MSKSRLLFERYCRVKSEKHVSCLQIYLKRKTICIRSHWVIFDLCCNNYGSFFAPTRTLGGFIQLFAALREPLLLLASHPARKLLENRLPKTVFVHVFSCECVCLCVKIKGEREGVGYQSETSLL